MTLIPWQRWLYIHAFELRPDGRFRFRTLVVLVARQNGKTSMVEIKNLWKLYVLGSMLVIGTAQTLEYAEESWDKAVEIAEGTPDLAAEIAHVDKTNGKKSLKLKSGARWKIATATRRGGRSLSADDVNLDELREHQNWDSWGAVTKTTMAKPNAQIWAFSNAGDEKSIVLNDIQAKGRAAAARPEIADPSIGHFEWSAPDDCECTCGRPDGVHAVDCRLQDRTAWAQANPSMGYTVTADAIASALGTDPVVVFRTEVLCQHVEDLAEEWQVIPRPDWEAAADPNSERPSPVAFAVTLSTDRQWATIAAAGPRPDGLYLVHIVERRQGTGWVIGRLKELIERWKPVAVVIDRGSPASSIATEAEEAGIELTPISAREVAAAAGAFHDGFAGRPSPDPETGKPGRDPRVVRHRDQLELTAAVKAAVTRKLSTQWAWDQIEAPSDITPVIAASNALWGYMTRPQEPVQPFFGSYR